MAKKKAGRPKKDNPLGGVIRVRVLPKTVKSLEVYRRQHALINQAEAIRRLINDGLDRENLL